MITTKKHLCQRTTCICGMWFLWLPCTSIDTETEREKLGTYVTRVWCTCTCCIRRAEAVEWGFLLSHSEQLARPAISPGNCFGDPGPSECSLDSLECDEGIRGKLQERVRVNNSASIKWAHAKKKKKTICGREFKGRSLRKMLSLSATSDFLVSMHVCISTPPQKPKA